VLEIASDNQCLFILPFNQFGSLPLDGFRNLLIGTSAEKVPTTASLCFHPNGSNADKLPFSIRIFVQLATGLSMAQCAKFSHS
jgi:hypothetical protein